MGTGRDAAAQSRLVVELFRRLVTSGVEFGSAIKLINSLMVTKSQDESFATLDAVRIDLDECGLTVIKSGAAATLIRHRGSVLKITSPTFPIGIYESSEIFVRECDFEEGDIVFFGDEGNEYHQGIVVGMPDDRCGFYSSEGNHNNRVETVWHDIDENISGFGVPRYDDEPDESDDHHDDDVKPEPQPEPAPQPQPQPFDFRADYAGEWKINAPSGLRLRDSAGYGETLAVMKYGSTVIASGYYDTINEMDWLEVMYDGINGWCSREWLTDHKEE
jgi:hypothetical protein